MPKSDRYTWSGRPTLASTRMFPGLTSRCTNPVLCAASSAEATGETKSAARSGASAPSRSSTCRRSPPATYRIAMNSTPSASPASYTGMMCGSSTAAAARDSAMNRRRNSGLDDARAGERIFNATGRPRRSSRARNTTANPPRPTCCSRRYPASTEPARNSVSCAAKSSLNAPPPKRLDYRSESAGERGLRLGGRLLIGTELRPQGAEGAGGLAAGGERADRGALHGHALDLGQSRDGGSCHAGPFGQKFFGDLLVQALTAVNHREEGADLGLAAVKAGHELGELVQRADRQRGRDQRDQQDVGGVHDVLRDQGDAGRAVQEHVVVLAGQRAEQLGELAGGGPGFTVQDEVHVAVGEVGREQVQVVEIGALDRLVQGLGAADERLPAALDPGLDPEQEAGRALRVQVPQQGAVAVGGRQVGQVDRGGGLADAALDVVRGEDLHRPAPPGAEVGRGLSSRSRMRCWPAGPANLVNRWAKSARASAWLCARFAAISPMASSVAAGAARSASIAAARAPISWRCTSLSWNSPRQSCSCFRSPTTFRYATGSCSGAKNSST